MREPFHGLPGGMGFGNYVMTTGPVMRRNLNSIVADTGASPEGFYLYGEIRIGGELIRHWDDEGNDLWAMTKPKEGAIVELYFPMQGGKLGKILSLVAVVALIAIATFISGGGLTPFLGPAFAAGSFGALALSAGVGILGRLAISALTPPAGRDKKDNQQQAPVLGNAGADSNVLNPGGSILRVCGVDLKTYPPLACYPLVDLAGDDEFVEAAYLFAGPHRLNDIRIEDSKIDEIDELQYLVDDGTSTKPASMLYRRGNQRVVNFELVGHRRSKENLEDLLHPDNPSIDTPKPRVEVSRFDPDEIWLHLIWPNGMTDQQNNYAIVMPFRLRMRIVGSTQWINLPELLFHCNRIGAVRKSIKLIWDATPPVNPDQSYTNGAWEKYHTVPAQTKPPVGIGGWSAHSSFVLNAGVINSTRRVFREAQGFTVYLDPAVFARGNKWEVEITRGGVIDPTLFTQTSYIYGPVGLAAKMDFFGYEVYASRPVAPGFSEYNLFKGTLVDQVQLLRFASVKNNPPILKGGNARIEIRAKNVQVSRLSAKASGLIPRWDGTEWTGSFVSDNPADHFRYVAADALTRDPVEPDALDNTAIITWRAECAAKGYTIAAAFDGRPWSETLKAIASAGFARVKAGDKLSVTWDRDRSAENPKQVFSKRNSNNFAMIKSFERIPDAIRVTYRNRALGHDQDERTVIRPGLKLADVEQIEAADAVGLDTPAAVDARFKYDLESADLRDHSISFDTTLAAASVCEMGDLVEVNHIMLDRRVGAARAKVIRTNVSNQVTEIELDGKVVLGNPTSLHLDTDISTEADLSLLGTPFAAAAETTAGVLTFALTHKQGEASTITLTTPLATTAIQRGCHIAVGPSSEEKGRYIVTSIEPQSRLSARVNTVPEAPGLWQ